MFLVKESWRRLMKRLCKRPKRAQPAPARFGNGMSVKDLSEQMLRESAARGFVPAYVALMELARRKAARAKKAKKRRHG